jgi:hypothetical protein
MAVAHNLGGQIGAVRFTNARLEQFIRGFGLSRIQGSAKARRERFPIVISRPCGHRSLGSNMLRQFLVGGAVSLLNIVIHALVMTTIVRVAHTIWAQRADRFVSLLLIAVMVPTVTVFMVAHTLEVFVWSAAYSIVGAAPANADLVDFAFVNYTTLGTVTYFRWSVGGCLAQ